MIFNILYWNNLYSTTSRNKNDNAEWFELNRGVSGKADVGVQNLSINWDIQSRITKNKYREQKRVKKVVERVRGMSS